MSTNSQTNPLAWIDEPSSLPSYIRVHSSPESTSQRSCAVSSTLPSNAALNPTLRTPLYEQYAPLSSLQHTPVLKRLTSMPTISTILNQVDSDILRHLDIVNRVNESPAQDSSTRVLEPKMGTLQLVEQHVQFDDYLIPFIHGQPQVRGAWKYKTGAMKKPSLLGRMSSLFKD
jgi:hypothetical protein